MAQRELDIQELVNFFDPSRQRGAGGDYYIPTYRRQRGEGIGSIFRTIGSYLIPFAKKYLLPSALGMVRDVAGDVLNDGDLRSSLKTRGVEAIKKGISNITNQSGSGLAAKRKKKKSLPKSKYKLLKRIRTCYDG